MTRYMTSYDIAWCYLINLFNLMCYTDYAKLLPNTPKSKDVIEAYFASLTDLSFEVKSTVKNESQISNEYFRYCVMVK